MTEKGECRDGESEGNVVKTSRWLSSKGECSDGKSEGDVEEMCRKCEGDFNFTKVLNYGEVCDAKAILRLFKHLRRNDTKKKG